MCRTSEEFSGGHAIGAINVPYMFKIGSGLCLLPVAAIQSFYDIVIIRMTMVVKSYLFTF